jgi:excisionase family DNA binding protein
MTAAREVTVREAAHRARRSAETIRRWIWSGRLAATKRGNTYYVDVMQLDGLVAAMGITAHGTEPARPGDLGAWLDELGQWRSGLAAPASETASDLVIEDRRARR